MLPAKEWGKMTDQFWKRKSLSEMSVDEWESLCDGCALCCLQKFEDEETGEVFFTDVACKMLDTSSRRCIAYRVRAQKVPPTSERPNSPSSKPRSAR